MRIEPENVFLRLNESQWGEVDDSSDPQDFAAYLEYMENAKVGESLRGKIFDLLPIAGCSQVLDAGCGLGAHSRALAKKIGSNGSVRGMDKSRVMIEKARAYPVERGSAALHFEMGDICELPYSDESFDAVFTDRVFIHVSEPERALAEFFRVLKPGGHVVMAETDWSKLSVTPDSHHMSLLVEEKVNSFANATFGGMMNVYLKNAGFEVQHHEVVCYKNGDYDMAWRIMNLEEAGHRTIARGLMSEDEFAFLKKSLKEAGARGELETVGAMCFGRARKGMYL